MKIVNNHSKSPVHWIQTFEILEDVTVLTPAVMAAA